MGGNAVIFDVGGVLADDMHMPMLMKLAQKRDKPQQVERFRRAGSDAWRKIAVDSDYTEDQFWAEIIKEAGLTETVEELKAMLRCERMRPFWGPLALAERLKKRGYLVGMLSNHCREWFTELWLRFRLGDIFDGDLCVVSFQIGCTKPDWPHFRPYSAIYERLHRVAGVKKSNCVFVDDKKANVDAASAFGMDSKVFDARKDDVVELVHYLVARGIDAGERP
jgi:FMN phosphatase YigB (HAD superfamily)